MRARLSILMFLQYAVPGAWVPILSLHLHELGFDSHELAWGCATSALGALLAPMLWGQIADRWVAAQHCISFCAFAGGCLLWLLAELREPLGVFLTGLGFWFFMIPALSLGTALTFRHLPVPDRQFGPVRMWGTVGWVLTGWLLSYSLTDPAFWRSMLAILRPGNPRSELADAFRIGGAFAFLLSAYAWTLPSTPPSRPSGAPEGRRGWLRGFDATAKALHLFRQRTLFVYAVSLAGLYVTMPFSAQMTPLLLRQQGVSSSQLPVLLTIAQSLEIATLILLPTILLRLGEKGTLLLGILAWATALSILAVGEPGWLVMASLGLHGMYITCFLVAGQVCVNRRAAADIRASAQGLIQFINGTGLLIGHLVVGWVRDWAGGDFRLAFAPAAILTIALAVMFVSGFRAGRGSEARQTLPGPDSRR